MGKTYLHKEKGRAKRGLYGDNFDKYPMKVQKYYDRHCGTIDDKLSKMEIEEMEEKEIEKEEKEEYNDNDVGEANIKLC